MITICPFCDFSRKEVLSEDILKILSQPGLPFEDYELWFKRLFKTSGYKAYDGVKVHIGRMHKKEAFKYIQPDFRLEAQERRILNGV